MMRAAAAILAAGFAASATAGFAQPSIETMRKASSIGQVIGSEEYCGLSYDQAAIAKWIEENVDPAELDFTSHLSMAVGGEKYEQQDRTQSEKTAHCAAITRSAKHFGFIGA